MTDIDTVKEAGQEKSAAPALTKGFSILELVASEPGLGFAAIRSRLGLPNSSCHHLISTLCQLGALQLRSDRGYILGLRLLELGTMAAGQRQIDHHALPFLRTLAQETQLTCHLGVLEGHAAIYLMKVEGQREIRVNTWVGKRLSLHSSSLGKVLLASLPEPELEEMLRHIEWRAKCPNTLTDPERFRAHLREVRHRGWALDNEEDLLNIRCVAAPVNDAQGKVVAAISAVGTVLDISPERLDALAGQVCATAQDISHELGYPERGK
ncbi:IclR family transcriptional regulator [Azospirillum himalayense]|uniref:IclR family transcriptional regulator n=1 Tax=Azospirillum himalayense TaxID=654847 RepID=A0ABW0GH92_9PROT